MLNVEFLVRRSSYEKVLEKVSLVYEYVYTARYKWYDSDSVQLDMLAGVNVNWRCRLVSNRVLCRTL